MYQRAIRGGIFQANQAGSKLHIEPIRGAAAEGPQDKAEFFAAGMDEGLFAGLREELPKGAQIAEFEGIDNAQMPIGGDLHQAEFGQIGVFGDELRIEGDDFGARDDLAKVTQMLLRSDVFVPHANSLLTNAACLEDSLRPLTNYSLRK